ncbi:hypothetical protein NAT51_08540 [Flavobacterium amniphilum]|uniref:hypothetical protein n=1 Tax=Flavobacterium amniphilum TaxID=1834035 RepID=UPI00202A668A|nr:hypothetical protein [Flavobacterium amniphilum]MCL9805568.1 hypothetical protein [Flavobacterium amniphilum]
MKNTQKYIIAFITVFATITAIAFESNFSKENNRYNPQQDSFIGNYVSVEGGMANMYKKPEAGSKTKVALGQNLLVATKKSRGFVYGEFDVSSNKKLKGWFCLKDLEEIKFVAPKLN